MEQIFSINKKEMDTDYLTGLLNRRGLDKVWDTLSADMTLHGIYIDVDNFKLVNDIYGHSKGDELLIFVSDLLQHTFEGQIVVRMGGDEFVVICHGSLGSEEVKTRFPVLQDGLKNGGFDKTIASMLSFSIGVIFDQKVSDGLQELLRQCDEAMYYIKKNGKGSYITYDQIRDMVEENKAMKDRAFTALENAEIKMLLRPVIYLQTSEVYAAEAVLYWDFPSVGRLPEEKFMPIFVQYGIVAMMDDYAFEQVCRWKAGWKDTVFEHLDIYVRLSGLYILKDEGIGNIVSCLEKYRVDPKEIKICINEQDFPEKKEQMHYALQTLIGMGFQIAINNFGSASSFMVLKDIPSRILKLDAKLSAADNKDASAMHILKNVISLGRDLQKSIVGQEISNAGQVSALANYGAQLGTGSFCGEAKEESAFRDEYADRLYIITNREPVSFPFDGDLKDLSGKTEGSYEGTGLSFDRGVVSSQGALVFPGGGVKKNIVSFPGHLMHSDSYSICFWINPDEEQLWTSAVYVTFADGFLSLIPAAGRGLCFRIKDDREPNVWHDIFCRQAVPGKWAYICASYDMVTGISKLYFNGLLVGSLENVPGLKVAEAFILGGDEYQNSFKGRIAGLEIYHYVISAEYVQEKFQEYQKDETFLGTDGRK
ncbi:MAG: EAL domain-containing protein [Oscillospiraceae bacterium]|nr:EAL domain-containing protein [Oscillospiraceae bacterium]